MPLALAFNPINEQLWLRCIACLPAQMPPANVQNTLLMRSGFSQYYSSSCHSSVFQRYVHVCTRVRKCANVCKLIIGFGRRLEDIFRNQGCSGFFFLVVVVANEFST